MDHFFQRRRRSERFRLRTAHGLAHAEPTRIERQADLRPLKDDLNHSSRRTPRHVNILLFTMAGGCAKPSARRFAEPYARCRRGGVGHCPAGGHNCP